MTDPLDLDAIEARHANHGGYCNYCAGASNNGWERWPCDAAVVVAELRTARAERDAAKADADSTHAAWRASTEANQADYDALAARNEAAVARCRDSIMDRAVEPHAKAQARYVLMVLVDVQTPEDMAAALSGATEPAEGEPDLDAPHAFVPLPDFPNVCEFCGLLDIDNPPHGAHPETTP